MALEGFYGGRSGAPFIIVKRFDDVDIEENSVYRKVYYAVTSGGILIYPFVERNGLNYANYNWELTELDGSSVVVEDGSTQTLPRVYQEGMIQCFKKGGDSVDIVNYGEYVIIDTLSKDNPNNGKVYRRGLNYINDMGGAEYIGQIVGPSGETPEFKVDKYADFTDPSRKGTYTAVAGDIVPGYDEVNDVYNDEIKYAWASVRDENGRVESYQIGFVFPYAIDQIIGRQRSPYDSQGVPIPADEELIERIDDGTHPYFRKWRVNIPYGFKGDSYSEFKTFPVNVKKGSTVYANVDPDTGELTNPIVTPLADDTEIIVESYFDTYEKNYVELRVSDIKVYADLADCKDYHFGCLLTWYNEHEAGDHEWEDIGKYKVLNKVELSENGVFKVLYTCDDPEELEEVIRWIYFDNSVQNSGIQMNDEGTVTIWYNTLEQDGITHEHQTYDTQLSWITKVTLSDTGEFKVYYNNDRNKDATQAAGGIWVDEDHAYLKQINWIKEISMAEDGTITFTKSDDTTYDNPTKIKFVNEVSINTGESEGEGNQKVHIKYNDDTEEDIGNPLNYVVECLVTDINSWGAPYHHLLVWYSDPDYRSNLATSYIYRSEKDSVVKEGWADLGYVKGEPGGVRIIGNVSDEDDLYKDGSARTDPWKPEEIGAGWSTTPDMDYEGWIMTVQQATNAEFFAFDYNNNVWYSLGVIDSGDPRGIIRASATEPQSLNTYGYWFVVESGISV